MPSIHIILAYLGWALLWASVQVTLLWLGKWPLEIALVDALLTNALLACGSYAIGMGLKYYQPGARQVILVFGWSFGLAVISMTIFYFGINKLFSHNIAYLNFVEATLPVRTAFSWLMTLLLLLLTWMWFYTLSRQQDEKRKTAIEKLAREAELYNLRQQLQPHFLFNSLNSINALVGSRPEQARTMIHQLSDFLRGTLRKDNQKLVSLGEELKHLKLYLEIEKVRFGHRLKTAIDAQNETMNMHLPSLLLQPVVENAIKFGLYDTIGEIKIEIKASAINQHLLLQVQNPFDPTTARPKHGTGFGLSSVQRRLYLMYARQDLLLTEQQGHTFITTIKIPQ